MDSTTIVSGIALGFAIAAPVGPIGVLCIRRTLAEGRIAGLLSGLGAATADALYATVAASGLAWTAALVSPAAAWLRIGGALFLCWLGVSAFRAPVAAALPAIGGRAAGAARAYGSTLVLTITNPMTIASFAAVFAGLGFHTAGAAPAVLGAAVFAGSALWWLTLSSAVGLLRRHVSPRSLVWVNRVSGSLIFGFGIAALAAAIGSRG